MIIKIPKDAKTYEFSNSIVWIKEGIMFSVPKEDNRPLQSIAEIRSEMDELRKLLAGKKACMVLESDTRASSPPKEQRDFIAEEINSVTKAMAIVSSSPLSRMMANLFFSFKPPSYPFKMFSNEKDAVEWVRQYLSNS